MECTFAPDVNFLEPGVSVPVAGTLVDTVFSCTSGFGTGSGEAKASLQISEKYAFIVAVLSAVRSQPLVAGYFFFAALRPSGVPYFFGLLFIA